MSSQQFKKLGNKTILSLASICLLASLAALSQGVFAEEPGLNMQSFNFRLRESSLEILKDVSSSQRMSLLRKESGREEIGGEAGLVDEYLISDIPETEFLGHYSFDKSGFKDVNFSVESNRALFNKEQFSRSFSFKEQTENKLRALFGIKAAPEYQIVKEIGYPGSELATNLDLKALTVKTHYQEMGENIKQTVEVKNNTGQELTVLLLLKNEIDTDRVYWNDQLFILDSRPRKFAAPDKVFFHASNEENFSFYDYADIPDRFRPELWGERTGGRSFLVLAVTVSLSAYATETIDPTYGTELTILNVHSHPRVGGYWTVSFETKGQEDLIITPMDQATVDDLDFISLTCGEEEVTPQILDGDVIFYPAWSCEGETGRLRHLVNVLRPHTLRFEFGGQIAFAYNSPATAAFDDDFTEVGTSNVEVDSHDPAPTGDSWTQIWDREGGDDLVVSWSSDNVIPEAVDASGGAAYTADATYGNDQMIEYKAVDAGASDDYTYGLIRAQSSLGQANGGYVLYDTTDSTGDDALLKRVSGAATCAQLDIIDEGQIATALWPNNTIVNMVAYGSEITAFSDERGYLYAIDANIASGKGGFGMGALPCNTAGDFAAVQVIDDFEVYTLPESNTGWKDPTTTGETNNDFADPTYAYSENDSYAVEVDVSQYQDYGDFGISITPGATIEGIQVKVRGEAESDGFWQELGVELSQDNGSGWTSQKLMRFEQSVDDYYIYGTPLSLWGDTWASTDFSNSNFRIRLEHNAEESGLNGRGIEVDHVAVRVWYEGGGSNNAPSFSAGPSDGSSATSSPTNVGDDVTFTGTATDTESDDWKLLVCKTSDAPTPATSTPECSGGSGNRWCRDDTWRAAASQSTCNYTTQATDAGNNGWYAFACDNSATSAACSSASQGTGDNGSGFYVINPAPKFSVAPSDAGSAAAAPTNAGSNVTFTGTATDSVDSYKLLVCSTSAAPTAATPECAGGAGNRWCIDGTWRASSVQSTCSYTTATSSAESNDWYAFVCDNSAGSPSCSSASQGSGVTGSPFNVNQRPYFITVGDNGPKDQLENITFTATAFDNDTDTATDTLKMVVCKTAGVSGSACDGGAGDTYCTGTSTPISGKGYIFYDQFESGGLTNWSTSYHETNSFVQATTTYAHRGDYSLAFGGGDATSRGYVREDMASSYTTFYHRFYIYFPSGWNFGTAPSAFFASYADSDWNSRLVLYVEDVGGDPYFKWGSYDSEAAATWNNGNVTFTRGIWHYFEVKYVVNDGAGSVTVWVDGTQVVNSTGLDTGSTNVKYIYNGCTYAGGTFDPIYEDGIIFDDAQIGEEQITCDYNAVDSGTLQYYPYIFDSHDFAALAPMSPTFEDNFDDDSIDAGLWGEYEEAGTSVTETNQRIEITMPDNDTGDASLFSTTTYNLTDSYVHVEVPQVIDIASNHDTLFYLAKDSNNVIRLVQENGFLYMQQKIGGGAWRTAASPAYSTSTQRWWRIRHESPLNEIYWEISADGDSWYTQAGTSTPFAITDVEIGLEAIAWSAAPGFSPLTAYFDNLNIHSFYVTGSPPNFSAGPSDGGSSGSAPTNVGSNVTFTATATDSANSYKLLVCATSAAPTASTSVPTCAGGAGNLWCVDSSWRASSVQSTCNSAAATSSAESNAWWAFACDNDGGSPACSSGSQGGGATGSPFNINHRPAFDEAGLREN